MRALLLCLMISFALPLAACAPSMRGGSVQSQPHAMPVAEVQAGLTRLGFRPGAVDGIYGPRTRAALIDYQRIRGLPDTGLIDRATASRLRADLAALPAQTRPADDRVARAPDGTAPEMTGLDGTFPPETTDPLAPPAAAPSGPVSPAPETIYRSAEHDPSLVAVTETRPEDLQSVRYAEIDLDGDGDLDVIWNNTASRYCGTGGCSFDIYFREASGWRPVARLLAFEVDAASGTTRGVRDLLVTGRRGSAVWRWNGRHYAPAA